MNTRDIATLLITAVVLVTVVTIRHCCEWPIEITTNDLLVTVVAAVLMLFVTGRISEFEFGSKGVSVKSAIIAATRKPIDNQILPVTTIVHPEKGPLDQIQKYVAEQVPAIHFDLGSNRYNWGAIHDYLSALSSHSFFRFVVFLGAQSKLFGIVDARKLYTKLSDQNSAMKFDNFAEIVNRGTVDDLARLEMLPSFVPATQAIRRSTDKKEALETMQGRSVDWLPVIEDDGRFAGIVEQSRLAASLIVDVANALKK
jgi:hypothetical protein